MCRTKLTITRHCGKGYSVDEVSEIVALSVWVWLNDTQSRGPCWCCLTLLVSKAWVWVLTTRGVVTWLVLGLCEALVFLTSLRNQVWWWNIKKHRLWNHTVSPSFEPWPVACLLLCDLGKDNDHSELQCYDLVSSCGNWNTECLWSAWNISSDT